MTSTNTSGSPLPALPAAAFLAAGAAAFLAGAAFFAVAAGAAVVFFAAGAAFFAVLMGAAFTGAGAFLLVVGEMVVFAAGAGFVAGAAFTGAVAFFLVGAAGVFFAAGAAFFAGALVVSADFLTGSAVTVALLAAGLAGLGLEAGGLDALAFGVAIEMGVPFSQGATTRARVKPYGLETGRDAISIPRPGAFVRPGG